MTVVTAAFTRSVASVLLDRAERRTGSRMAAYEALAATLGTSTDWLRRFIKGQVKEPGWTTGWKVLDQYSRLCDRVEAEIELERTRILALKGQMDATASTINQMVASAARTAPARAE